MYANDQRHYGEFMYNTRAAHYLHAVLRESNILEKLISPYDSEAKKHTPVTSVILPSESRRSHAPVEYAGVNNDITHHASIKCFLASLYKHAID